MSIQEKFHSYSWAFSVVIAIILAIIVAVTVGLLCNCFWEITKPRILNFLYGICPCLDTVAHPNLPNTETRIIALEREQARCFTEIVNGHAHTRTSQETVLEGIREVNLRLDALSELALSNIEIHRHPMGESSLPLAGDSASSGAESSNSIVPIEESRSLVVGESSSSGAQPSNSTVLACVTLFLPCRTSFIVWTWVTDFLRRRARGSWLRWRGSIVIQEFLSIDSCVLAEIGELVKKCCSVENGFTLQIASWGIFYHNVDSVHLSMLQEGDVPVTIEARWNKKRTGITMRGLHLNGAQIKATTKRSSTTLRSSGPPSKGCGNLDELHFPTEGFKGVEESLIHAAKAVEFDGISLVVRSEATYVVPPKSFLKEILHDGLQKILKMTKSVLEPIPDLKTKQQLLVEHWEGVSQMEMIDCRNKVIIQFQNFPASEISTSDDAHPLRFITMCPSSRDREYWQRALHNLTEDHLSNGSSSLSSTVHSTGGRIKYLLGEFDNALLDFNRADKTTSEGLSLASTLLDRAMVKCALARYPEASQDINKAAEINPNSSDIKRFQACLEEILCIISSKSSTPILKPTQAEYDFLTGDQSRFINLRRYDRLRFLNSPQSELASNLDWTEVRVPSNDLPELDLKQGTSQDHDFKWIPQLLLDYLDLNGLTEYDSLRPGEKLAEGGQAEIFEAIGPLGTQTNLVLKVFKKAFPLQTLLQPGVLQFGGGNYLDHPSPFLGTALGLKFLKDGRCAFVFPRLWGDLRRLIDIQERKFLSLDSSTLVKIMLQIAKGMRSLHIRNILHRDLKASNILVSGDNPAREDFRCVVADFECSVGVMGTGFWRAPEILTQLIKKTSEPKELAWSKAADVYSFGITCYEIFTGCSPFEILSPYLDYDVVLSGSRPWLPSSLDSKLMALIELCWHADPKQRPNFSEICEVLLLM